MTDKLIKKYREKALSLDFKEIKLTQLGEGKNKTFEGPGYIDQKNDGTLIYKLFSNSGTGLIEFFNRYSGIEAGEVIPKEYYYSFEGVDIHDRKWTSERVDIDQHASKEFTVVQDKLRKIETTTTLPPVEGKEREGEFHQVWIPYKIDLPSNLSKSIKHFVGDDEMKSSFSHSAAEFENSFLKLLLFHDDDWLIIQIKVDEDNFHPFVFERVLGALQYVLAEPLKWVIHEKRIKDEYTTIFRPFQEYKKSKFKEPIQLIDGNENKAWEIFEDYLNHGLLNKDDHNDPITNVISKCIAVGQGSYDAYSLTISLAIEEILNTSFNDLSVQKNVREEDISLMKKTVKKLDIGNSFKDRLYSYLGYIKQVSATDKLRHLIDISPITRQDYDDWKAIRNHFAHPDDAKLNTQEKVDKTHLVLTLLHKLIFLKIGYQGPYNDFGERNWPQKEWSLNNSA